MILAVGLGACLAEEVAPKGDAVGDEGACGANAIGYEVTASEVALTGLSALELWAYKEKATYEYERGEENADVDIDAVMQELSYFDFAAVDEFAERTSLLNFNDYPKAIESFSKSSRRSGEIRALKVWIHADVAATYRESAGAKALEAGALLDHLMMFMEARSDLALNRLPESRQRLHVSFNRKYILARQPTELQRSVSSAMQYVAGQDRDHLAAALELMKRRGVLSPEADGSVSCAATSCGIAIGDRVCDNTPGFQIQEPLADAFRRVADYSEQAFTQDNRAATVWYLVDLELSVVDVEGASGRHAWLIFDDVSVARFKPSALGLGAIDGRCDGRLVDSKELGNAMVDVTAVLDLAATMEQFNVRAQAAGCEGPLESTNDRMILPSQGLECTNVMTRLTVPAAHPLAQQVHCLVASQTARPEHLRAAWFWTSSSKPTRSIDVGLMVNSDVDVSIDTLDSIEHGSTDVTVTIRPNQD